MLLIDKTVLVLSSNTSFFLSKLQVPETKHTWTKWNQPVIQ